jgi:hypothetical protein
MIIAARSAIRLHALKLSVSWRAPVYSPTIVAVK